MEERDFAKLVNREDGSWEVNCPECERSQHKPRLIGIGIPIVSRVEAEGIVRNHGGTGLKVAS